MLLKPCCTKNSAQPGRFYQSEYAETWSLAGLLDMHTLISNSQLTVSHFPSSNLGCLHRLINSKNVKQAIKCGDGACHNSETCNRMSCTKMGQTNECLIWWIVVSRFLAILRARRPSPCWPIAYFIVTTSWKSRHEPQRCIKHFLYSAVVKYGLALIGIMSLRLPLFS